jgi:ATP-dependent DNA helicase RecG
MSPAQLDAAGSNQLADRLAEPLRRSVGKDAAKLANLGLHTAGDLLRHYPRRYLPLNELGSVADLPLNELVTMVGEVQKVSTRQMVNRPGTLMNVVVVDAHGQQLHLTFFNKVVYHRKALTVGTRAIFTGRVSVYQGTRQLAHPAYQLLDADVDLDSWRAGNGLREVLPIYPASEKSGLDSAKIQRSVRLLLDTLGDLPDPIPAEVRSRHGLVDLSTAFQHIHRPPTMAEQRRAERRLKFEEAFVLQSVLARRRHAEGQLPAAPRVAVRGGLLDALDARLPFRLTQGQAEIGRQIAEDLAAPHPMHRLLQGEVGSGKTLVALRAMLAVVDAGGQAALLAPTEVLAAQHHRSISAMLGDLALGGLAGGLGTRLTLLTGSLPAATRKRALLEAASGEAGIIVGTHALLSEHVQFADLGLVVVDEQHRFGVEQRDVLRAKGGSGGSVPHLLVMTATPIPRTVAMTVFGDLEVSTLTELPAGRSPISTHVVLQRNRAHFERVWRRIREEADGGHQAFVVCPRIGEPGTEELDPMEQEYAPEPGEPAEKARRPALSAIDTVARLRELPDLAGLTIELLHGRMPAEARDDVMRRFTAGEVQVLVATTVVEVGVDVPNATVMVVMDADRFGVSQLHQLRGRIGRGSAPGVSLLVTEVEEGPPRERLDAVAGTVDGFELARVDLEQRREGDVLGSAQSGRRSSLRLIRVLRDEKLIEAARHEASALVAADPELAGHPALQAAIRVWVDDDREVFLERG